MDYFLDINIGPGLRICEEREQVEIIRRIKNEVKAFQAEIYFTKNSSCWHAEIQNLGTKLRRRIQTRYGH